MSPPLPVASRLGVCSWSLRPTSPDDLARKLTATGLRYVQLDLEPLRKGAWDESVVRDRLQGSRVAVLSGMMSMLGEDYSSLDSIRATGGLRPDTTWEANRLAADECAVLAERMGLDLVSFHAGFLPHGTDDPERVTLLDRLRTVIDIFEDRGVHVALETGQESADTLLAVLEELDRPTVGVNFDPANMILYGMGDPVLALDRLSVWVRQIHIKDAQRATQPGQWGSEVPVGTGEVDWSAFFGLVRARDMNVDLVIEREAGEERVADVCTARDLVTRTVGGHLVGPS